MKKGFSKNTIEVWGGIECTLNRVQDKYIDQLELCGHYNRGVNDIKRFAELGIKTIRYPVLWERHAPGKTNDIDWDLTSDRLSQIKQAGIEPIAGLVHHGSGPAYVSFFDGSFEKGLAAYAAGVAIQFPWLQYYTPVNEPVTTARFCGLYGLWYPHKHSGLEFLQILLAECKGTVLAMKEIRKTNPAAKLVQTEDLGKIYSTTTLQYQADFENNRRWLSYDLLCGKVDKTHELYDYLRWEGISDDDLAFFTSNPCPPDIIGINHYITSDRWLDERLEKYPADTHGGNGRHRYADVEAVRVGKNEGTKPLLREAWERYSIPLAVTEVHLHCTREEQMRWFKYIWNSANELQHEGLDIKAVTAWAMLGSFDWASLLTVPAGIYEAGLYDIRSAEPRPTALTKMIKTIAEGSDYHHPVLEEDGWWQRPCAVLYNLEDKQECVVRQLNNPNAKPLVIIGKTGTLGKAFKRICEQRGIPHIILGREDINITDRADIQSVLRKLKPWAIINTAGYVRVDDAENDSDACFLVNSTAPSYLAEACHDYGIRFITYSSDLVFDGKKNNPYLESDIVSPLNIYGQSKAMAEECVLATDPTALIIRTSAFFGPWDQHNFVYNALRALKNEDEFASPDDVIVSPTYVPDLVHTSLDLLLDEASGIWNISNKGGISWAMLASEVAERSGFNPKHFKKVMVSEMNFIAQRPAYTVLNTEKGFELPNLHNALERFFKEQELITL